MKSNEIVEPNINKYFTFFMLILSTREIINIKDIADIRILLEISI